MDKFDCASGAVPGMAIKRTYLLSLATCGSRHALSGTVEKLAISTNLSDKARSLRES